MKVLMIFISALLLASISSLANAGLTGDTADRSWRFRVYLDDRPIGFHLFSLSHKDDYQQMQISAQFDVTMLLIPIYSYRHSNTEIWHGGCLQQLTSFTDDDGDLQFVQLSPATQQASRRLISPAGERQLSGCIRSFAYWDAKLLNSERLLNAQTGELLHVSFTEHGRDTLVIDGHAVNSTRYLLSGEQLNIQLWYSEAGDWLALQSETADGYLLRYTRVEEQAP